MWPEECHMLLISFAICIILELACNSIAMISNSFFIIENYKTIFKDIMSSKILYSCPSKWSVGVKERH